MKKLLLLAALAFSLAVNAQNFPGELVQLLEGKELKVSPLSEPLQKYGYRGFYTDDKLKKVYKEKSNVTPYEKLQGKTFKFVSYEAYKDFGTPKYKLKIDNTETGALYFEYDPRYSNKFPFEVIGGITFPSGYFCEKAVEKKTEGDKSRKYDLPVADGITLSYFRDESFKFMFLTINTPSDIALAKDAIARGVTLTFDNGKTIDMPDEQLKFATGPTGKTVLSALIGFIIYKNEAEIELLKNHKLVKIKLYKTERDFSEGYTLKEYVKCATK